MRSVNMLLFVVLLLGAPWRNANAIEYCVGTVAELTVALNDAAGESSELFTTTVKLKQGTYHIGGTRLTQPNQAFFHALELLGGYNSDCSARVIKPDNTVFDADADGTLAGGEGLGMLPALDMPGSSAVSVQGEIVSRGYSQPGYF